MSTYILWDIDGTLIYNTPTAGSLYLDAIEHVTGVRPSIPVENPHGMTEGQLLVALLEANDLDPARLGEVLYDLDVLSREQHERGLVRDACVGVDAALQAVSERGWTNALLTGNGPNRARYKLLAAGIDPALFDWAHSYFGHESPTRHHLTAGARSALGRNDAFIIGDTPNDGLAADSSNIPFVAVATGFYSADELRRTSAIVVVDDLETGLDDILEGIDAAVAVQHPAAPEDTAETVVPQVSDDAGAAAADGTDGTDDGRIAEPDQATEDFGESPDVEVPVDEDFDADLDAADDELAGPEEGELQQIDPPVGEHDGEHDGEPAVSPADGGPNSVEMHSEEMISEDPDVETSTSDASFSPDDHDHTGHDENIGHDENAEHAPEDSDRH